MELFKFPRTKHLFDAGGSGVSRDDLLMDAGEAAAFYTHKKGKTNKKQGSPVLVAMEEKVDGANLGISLDPETHMFRVQNRSHFVNSKTHRQFSTLDTWLDEHSEGLYKVLSSGNYVLFGEWLYAKHSIAYTRLPDYFLAFDVYDYQEGKFFTWRKRNAMLDGTGISTVRLIAEQTISGREEALKWMNSDSIYYDGPCEGIYFRVDSDASPTDQGTLGAEAQLGDYCIHRGKLVRPDFLQGIESQWTKQNFTKNIVQWS